MLPKPDINRPLFQHPDFHVEAIYTQMRLCPMCESPIREEDFVDEVSRREYSITGFCQACQDIIFDESEEYDDSEFEPPF